MQNNQYSASKIMVELTIEELENLMTEAALKAVELSKQKPDHWNELPDLMTTAQAKDALKISVSTFKRRVSEGLIKPHYEKPGGHPLFNKADLKEMYYLIVGNQTKLK